MRSIRWCISLIINYCCFIALPYMYTYCHQISKQDFASVACGSSMPWLSSEKSPPSQSSVTIKRAFSCNHGTNHFNHFTRYQVASNGQLLFYKDIRTIWHLKTQIWWQDSNAGHSDALSCSKCSSFWNGVKSWMSQKMLELGHEKKM